MNYFFHLVVLTEIFVLLAISLNLIMGYGGLVTLAHSSLYGIGAYIFALLTVFAGWNFTLAAAAATTGSVLISFVISLAAYRFKGDYFILATLGFQVIVYSFLLNCVEVTRGPFGIARIPRPQIGSSAIDTIPSFAVLGLIMVTSIVAVLAVIAKSPYGRALQAVRDDEIAATTLGKSPNLIRTVAIAVASATAGIAGVLYASYIGFIDPNSFTVDESLLLFSMVIVGGTGNFKGPILGAMLLVLIPESMRFVSLPPTVLGQLRLIIYGILLVFLMRTRPQGLFGRYRLE